jgi:hypothetical protein
MNKTIRLAVLALFIGVAAARAEPLTIDSQGSFFIGGKDVKSDTLLELATWLVSWLSKNVEMKKP